MMSEEQCLEEYETHNYVLVDSGNFGLRVEVCTRCGAELLEEVEPDG